MKANDMPAGRELDALIAAKIMGWKWDDHTAYGPHGERDARAGRADKWEWLRYYSTDMSDAWLVVEKIISIPMDTDEHYQVRAKFQFTLHDIGLESLMANQAALAICRAALKAVGAGD